MSIFSSVREELHYKYYESFIEYWILIYKRQVFKSKFNNDKEDLKAIKENIMKNWHFDDSEKKYILEVLGIKYLIER